MLTQVVEATASQQTLVLGALPAGTYSVTVNAPSQATVSQRGGG